MSDAGSDGGFWNILMHYMGIPQPTPPPSDPYSYTNDHQVAQSYIDMSGNIGRSYDPSYYQYDPVSRQGFDVHEDVHKNQLLNYPQNFIGDIMSRFDHATNNAQWEVPAYQKQIDFYQNYLMTHPSDTPGWGNVLRTQQQIFDTLDQNYPKK
jgi:hypothetical protein